MIKKIIFLLLFVSQLSYCSHAFKVLIPFTLSTLCLASQDQEHKGSAFIVQTAITCTWTYMFFHYHNRYDIINDEKKRMDTNIICAQLLNENKQLRQEKFTLKGIHKAHLGQNHSADDIAFHADIIQRCDDLKNQKLRSAGLSESLTNDEINQQRHARKREYNNRLSPIWKKEIACGAMSLAGMLSIGYFFYTID